jgi:hypothetical protein
MVLQKVSRNGLRRDHELIKAALQTDDGAEIDLSQWNELQDLLDRRVALRIARRRRGRRNAELLHRQQYVRGNFPAGVSAKYRQGEGT